MMYGYIIYTLSSTSRGFFLCVEKYVTIFCEKQDRYLRVFCS
jgi:hypothetical protein